MSRVGLRPRRAGLGDCEAAFFDFFVESRDDFEFVLRLLLDELSMELEEDESMELDSELGSEDGVRVEFVLA